MNIGSLNGTIAPPFLGAYAASKFALEAASDSLRAELHHWRIHVSVVEPAAVATPIWKRSYALADELAEQVGPEVIEPYAEDLESFRKVVRRMEVAATSAERVVKAVVHALTAPRPRIRYYTTWPTRLCFKIFQMVPDRIRDRVIRRASGLK